MKGRFFNSIVLRRRIFWGWVILIVILTSMPANPDILHLKKDGIIRLDYLEHVFFFVVLSVLYYMAYLTIAGHVTGIKIYYWFSAGIVFASITEIYQIIIPGRAYNPVDLGLNLAGLLIGIPLGKWITSRINFDNV